MLLPVPSACEFHGRFEAEGKEIGVLLCLISCVTFSYNTQVINGFVLINLPIEESAFLCVSTVLRGSLAISYRGDLLFWSNEVKEFFFSNPLRFKLRR